MKDKQRWTNPKDMQSFVKRLGSDVKVHRHPHKRCDGIKSFCWQHEQEYKKNRLKKFQSYHEGITEQPISSFFSLN